MTKPLWQLMIDQSDMALGAPPPQSYSADDALIAQAHLAIVIRHIRCSENYRRVCSDYRYPMESLFGEMLAGSVTDGDSTTDPSPSAS
jgi:hypothetical protein